MDFTELKVSEFLELLASDAPAPGGGAAAALAGSLGAALVEMVVSLTIGKEKYKEFEPLMIETGARSKKLREDFNKAALRDAEAFGLVSAAYKMEKDTPEKEQKKKEALQAALKQAALAPLALMDIVLEAIQLCERAIGNSNPNVEGDLFVAAVLLKAAAQGAHINVQANLPGITDKELVSEYDERSRRILAEITGIADTINK